MLTHTPESQDLGTGEVMKHEVVIFVVLIEIQVYTPPLAQYGCAFKDDEFALSYT